MILNDFKKKGEIAMKVLACMCLIFSLIIFMPTFSLASCSSDFDCGMGYRCVKAPLQSYGSCMKEVDEYGTPTYELPRLNSVGPNMNIEGDCDFDTDCPIGFRCHRKYKTCVK